jgi:peptidylprolyl isomerase
MKALALLLILLFGTGSSLEGCGKGENENGHGWRSPAQIAPGKGRFARIIFFSGDVQPRMTPSHLAPPRKVLSRDLRVGTGKVARRGDRLNLYYYSVNYRTAKRVYFRWPPQQPLTIRLGNEHWERPLAGMRVGGRREVVVPSHLLFKTGTIDYLFELRRVGGRTGGDVSGR